MRKIKYYDRFSHRLLEIEVTDEVAKFYCSEIKPLAMQVRNEELLALHIDVKYSPMLELYLRTQN